MPTHTNTHTWKHHSHTRTHTIELVWGVSGWGLIALGLSEGQEADKEQLDLNLWISLAERGRGNYFYCLRSCVCVYASI